MIGSRLHRPTHSIFDIFQMMDNMTGGIEDEFSGFPVDVRTRGEEIIVRADVPGISKKDLTVTLKDGSLSILGERKCEKKESETLHQSERTTGTFRRKFKVPEDVDEESIQATLQDGVLELILKRFKKKEPRRIEIG